MERPHKEVLPARPERRPVLPSAKTAHEQRGRRKGPPYKVSQDRVLSHLLHQPVLFLWREPVRTPEVSTHVVHYRLFLLRVESPDATKLPADE